MDMITKFGQRNLVSSIIILIVLIAGLVPSRSAFAVDGLPGSPLFGYGARLDLQGQGIRQSVELAAGMNLTWLLVEFDWAFYWSDPQLGPKWNQLDHVAKLASENKINLGISISNPPVWAITDQGPDPEKTALLVVEIARRYPGLVLAVELFPGANTRAGWSAYPDPKAFTFLLQNVSSALSASALDIQLITSLIPLGQIDDSNGVADEVFLNGLYASGWQNENSILGIHYNDITGDAIQPPSRDGLPVLRHYEELRNILIQYHDEQRLIWITGFSWPVELSTQENIDVKQASWLFTAYRLLTAQLYIGAAFFEQINPNSASKSTGSLLQPDATIHPACSLISQLTNSTNIVVPDPDQKYLFISSMLKNITK